MIDGFVWRSTRSMKRVLPAAQGQTETAVEDSQIRVAAGPYAEVEAPILRIGVIPIAVVNVVVAGGDLCNRLGCLVNRIIIEFGQHGAPPEWVAMSMAQAVSHNKASRRMPTRAYSKSNLTNNGSRDAALRLPTPLP